MSALLKALRRVEDRVPLRRRSPQTTKSVNVSEVANSAVASAKTFAEPAAEVAVLIEPVLDEHFLEVEITPQIANPALVATTIVDESGRNESNSIANPDHSPLSFVANSAVANSSVGDDAVAVDVADVVKPMVDDFPSALRRVASPESIIAFLSCGPLGEFASFLRELAGQVADRFGGDVVLLGPGLLNSPRSLAEHRQTLLRRADYAFLHGSTENLDAKSAGLRETAGVVLVIELGRTPAAQLSTIRRRLAEQKIPLLGSIVLVDK